MQTGTSLHRGNRSANTHSCDHLSEAGFAEAAGCTPWSCPQTPRMPPVKPCPRFVGTVPHALRSAIYQFMNPPNSPEKQGRQGITVMEEARGPERSRPSATQRGGRRRGRSQSQRQPPGWGRGAHIASPGLALRWTGQGGGQHREEGPGVGVGSGGLLPRGSLRLKSNCKGGDGRTGKGTQLRLSTHSAQPGIPRSFPWSKIP